MQENKVSISGKFITLTYDTEHIPITKNGFMTLDKKDVQDFIKRLRYYEETATLCSRQQYESVKRGGKIEDRKIRYYAAGEYGSKRKRPHYHLIVFNIKDEQSVYKAWQKGSIHIDDVNNNTIDYTLKYIMKPSNRHKFKAFDGQIEFSLMSKGLGDNFRNREIDKFYQDNLDINYLVTDKGFKIPMIRTFRDKILSKEQKNDQIILIKKEVDKQNARISENARIFGAQHRAEVLRKMENNGSID